MSRAKQIVLLRRVYDALLEEARFPKPDRGEQIALADAIEHLGAAIRNLGGNTDEENE